MRVRKMFGAALLAGVIVGTSGGVAMAGEVTGSGKGGPNGNGVTGMVGKTSSECAYSGLEDGPFQDDPTNTKPGRLTQTPHYVYDDNPFTPEEGFVNPPPGVPGNPLYGGQCRGNG